MNGEFRIRAATAADVPVIFQFIRELAAYEKLSHEVTASEKLLLRNLFGESPKAEVILAGKEDVEFGFALFSHNFFHVSRQAGDLLGRFVRAPQVSRHGFRESDDGLSNPVGNAGALNGLC